MKPRNLRSMSPEEKALSLYNDYVIKGLSYREIAYKYATTHQNISLILKGKLSQDDVKKHDINRMERKYEQFKLKLANIDKDM